MSTPAHPLLKAATIAIALTLLSGFVLFRHRSGSASMDPLMAAYPVDSPETKAAAKEIRIDSFHMDEPLPSSKSGIVFPPEEQQRRMLSSSKSGAVFETPPSALVNDSALKDAKAQDTLK